MQRRKILLSLCALGSLLPSLALAWSIFGADMQQSFAQSSGVTATDFSLKSGHDP
jgi:hypothetical protein